jgi:hypothetical protein
LNEALPGQMMALARSPSAFEPKTFRGLSYFLNKLSFLVEAPVGSSFNYPMTIFDFACPSTNR